MFRVIRAGGAGQEARARARARARAMDIVLQMSSWPISKSFFVLRDLRMSSGRPLTLSNVLLVLAALDGSPS